MHLRVHANRYVLYVWIILLLKNGKERMKLHENLDSFMQTAFLNP